MKKIWEEFKFIHLTAFLIIALCAVKNMNGKLNILINGTFLKFF